MMKPILSQVPVKLKTHRFTAIMWFLCLVICIVCLFTGRHKIALWSLLIYFALGKRIIWVGFPKHRSRNFSQSDEKQSDSIWGG